ncbi:VOC family protein [Pyxidicoccus parkwayensis]|jgi:catechol 2,3-dioxygenase-like lactoylglutathione lyase family enzyme|uniref:VOC family protein n=1 Tax=Pyxidicoccus parkwayensis TaxID=2813578 RepID=A0ABX7NKW6_9BACT|nr:VOC family protein [Pyxidicoccus parkwaysis]QSQ19500.1 VOC family protein [Pyxidicoccus parkwaysis]
MKLNHLDLQVPDVQRTAQFFERYFDFEHTSNRASPAIAILSDRAGLVLVLQKLKNPEQAYPDGFHIGFFVDSEDQVMGLHARAKEDGLEVSDVIRNNRGTMVYCQLPGGILAEVNCRPHSG